MKTDRSDNHGIHTKHGIRSLQIETTRAVLGDAGRYLTEASNGISRLSIDPDLIDWPPAGIKPAQEAPSLAVLPAFAFLLIAALFALWAGFKTDGWVAILLLFFGTPILLVHCLVCGGALYLRRTNVSAVLTSVATAFLLFLLMMFRTYGDGADHWHTFQAILHGTDAYTDMTTPVWWTTVSKDPTHTD